MKSVTIIKIAWRIKSIFKFSLACEELWRDIFKRFSTIVLKTSRYLQISLNLHKLSFLISELIIKSQNYLQSDYIKPFDWLNLPLNFSRSWDSIPLQCRLQLCGRTENWTQETQGKTILITRKKSTRIS